VIGEYAAHYHDKRRHQGIGNVLLSGALPQSQGVIETQERLGGLLKYSHREAAQPYRVFGHYGVWRERSVKESLHSMMARVAQR
jgi:hypothetical protein